jgi:cytochrome c2
LEAFLKKPEAYHPFTAMPNFQLKDDEAAALASFLHHQSIGKGIKSSYNFPKGDATRGAALSESLQCGTCHPGLPGGVSKSVSLDGIFKVDWMEKGCASGKEKRPGIPVPNLTAEDKNALFAFSKSGSDSLKKDSSAEFAQRQILAKRCIACHSMDDQASLLGALHHSTEGLAEHIKEFKERVDQSRPQLTFIGEMLYSDYIESILAGTVKERPRPWLGTRMPAFKSYAKPLAEGLSRLHGFEPGGPIEEKLDPEFVKVGHDLVGAEGFACTTCHGIGDAAPTAAFEVGAINFDQVSKRLREEYFHRWMDHPAAVIPGNKMPRYSEGNVSPRQDVLDGDAQKQYDAIWQWIHSLSEK